MHIYAAADFNASLAKRFVRSSNNKLVFGYVCVVCAPNAPIEWAPAGARAQCACGRDAFVPPMEFPYTDISEVPALDQDVSTEPKSAGV